jgi:hypothetical protein
MGLGPIRFAPFVNQELLDLIFRTLSHTNRFVRENGFFTCQILAPPLHQIRIIKESVPSSSVSPDYSAANLDKADISDPLGMLTQMAKSLAKGLADNWSQVRFGVCTTSPDSNFLIQFLTQ